MPEETLNADSKPSRNSKGRWLHHPSRWSFRISPAVSDSDRNFLCNRTNSEKWRPHSDVCQWSVRVPRSKERVSRAVAASPKHCRFQPKPPLAWPAPTDWSDWNV